MFIHNSRSENGRKTTASAPAVCRRISVATLTFIAGFPQTDFDIKLVNFFLKLVLTVILNELQSNFLISTQELHADVYHFLILVNDSGLLRALPRKGRKEEKIFNVKEWSQPTIH